MADPIAVVTTVKREDRDSIESEETVDSLERLYQVCRQAPPSSLVRITLSGEEGEVRLNFASFIREE